MLHKRVSKKTLTNYRGKQEDLHTPVRNARRIHVMSCQRGRAVPLRPIWTVMIAAKLDQSRVLVTKFRQNRLTMKVEEMVDVPVRDTDSQTGANFKMYLLRQFCSNRVDFFCNTQET